MTTADRIPPQSLEMEQAVLGAMLIERQAIEKAAEIISAGDFYRDAHGIIFEAIMELHSHELPVDILTVQEQLRRRELLENTGGAPYLVQLTDAVPTAVNVIHYAEIVKEKAIRRGLMFSAEQIYALAQNASMEASEMLSHAGRTIESVVTERLYTRNPFQLASISAADVPTGKDPTRLHFGLYQASVVLLVGETGAGKSSYLYNLAVHAASDEPYLGIPFGLGRPLRTLYIDPENAGNWEDGQGGVCAKRLDRIGAGRPADLYFHSGGGVNLSQAIQIKQLEEYIRRNKIDLCILDPIANLFGTDDENDNAEAARQMKMLVALSRKTRCCVIAVHHTGKDTSGNYGRGASARLAAADVGLVLRVRSNGDEFDDDFNGTLRNRDDICRLRIVKNRFEGQASLYLKMMGEDRFDRTNAQAWRDAEKKRIERPDKAESAHDIIFHMLEDGEWRDWNEISLALQTLDIGESNGRKALEALEKEGVIESRRAGKGGRLSFRRLFFI